MLIKQCQDVEEEILTSCTRPTHRQNKNSSAGKYRSWASLITLTQSKENQQLGLKYVCHPRSFSVSQQKLIYSSLLCGTHFAKQISIFFLTSFLAGKLKCPLNSFHLFLCGYKVFWNNPLKEASSVMKLKDKCQIVGLMYTCTYN